MEQVTFNLNNEVPATGDDVSIEKHLHDELEELKDVMLLEYLKDVELEFSEDNRHAFDLEQQR